MIGNQIPRQRPGFWRQGALVLLALDFLSSPALTHAAPIAPAGQILSIQGTGEYRELAQSRWQAAAVRQNVAEGHFVRTGDASRMAILLKDQTQIRLAANSMMQVKQVGDNRDRDTVLQQSAGRSWTQSKNVPDKLKVETPAALAAIRGTDWELDVAEDGTSTLTVLSGEVVLSNEQGSVTIHPGEQAQAQPGVAPVKRLLSQPRDRVQWVSSFTIDAKRYPELTATSGEIVGAGATASQAELHAIGDQLRAGELHKARRAVEQLIPQSLTSGIAYLLLADFQMMAGDTELSLATLQRGTERYPDDDRLDIARARIHLFRNELDAARAAVAAVLSRHPDSVEALIARGEIERIAGNGRLASADFLAAVARQEDSAAAWHSLGVVQTEREDVARARSSLHRALALAPEASGYRSELGTLEAFADDLPAARRAFDQSLERQPDDYVALTGKGLVALKDGQPDEAVSLLLAASLIEPRYARAQTTLAIAYYQLERVPAALFTLNRARELDPRDPLPDLLESLIRNDQLHPGDALDSARRAVSLLPYLKSLNQIANDQRGGANLGSALAAFGLEDWARYYAQTSYYPFWAGSHLFLADRYAGDFNKKSELFQGFLADPTVFGASNRFSTLTTRPGAYVNVGARYTSSRDFSLVEPTITANGYSNATVPFAYFAEAIRSEARPDRAAFDATANTYTLALGVRPSYELGLFIYANAFDATIGLGPDTLDPDTSQKQRVTGHNQRLDLGAHYRFSPDSQAWLKIGQSTESSTVSGIKTWTTYGDNKLPTNESNFQTRPEQHDIQLRHTFAPNAQHEFSWGGEYAVAKKANSLLQDRWTDREQPFHLEPGIFFPDRLDQHDEDRSRDIWLSDRARIGERVMLQGDLTWQHYRKTRDINIQRFQESARPRINETYDREFLSPRLGVTYSLNSGITVRGAYQKWLRPTSYNSLMPVATAGIPIDDTLVFGGGTLNRIRGQLDWEVSPKWFVTAFADHKKIDNLNSPLDGVLNTRADVTNLDRLRQKSIANLAAPDQLEASPVFSRGTTTSGGFTHNYVWSENVATYFGYVETDSKNTGTSFSGNDIPYLPKHRATLGLTWAGDHRLIISAQSVWRTARFQDEANRMTLPTGWDMTFKFHWESIDKVWSVEGYAGNLFKRGVDDLTGVNLVARF